MTERKPIEKVDEFKTFMKELHESPFASRLFTITYREDISRDGRSRSRLRHGLSARFCNDPRVLSEGQVKMHKDFDAGKRLLRYPLLLY